MRRLRLAVACVALIFAFVPQALAQSTVSPNDPTSGELVSDSGHWDGKQVTFTGEAITEAMVRGDFAWIHLNDDAYYLKNIEEGAPLGGYNSGHAVWVPRQLADRIAYFGDFKHEGDVVRVAGVFNAACAEHGGDMDIHAASLEVVATGRPVSETIHLSKLVAAVLLVALGLALGMASRRAQDLDRFGSLAKRRRAVRR